MNNAYVTMLCNGDGYVTGAEVLGRSIAQTGSRVPRVAMVTEDVSASARDRLKAGGWELRTIEPIANPSPKTSLLFPRFENVFSKLRAWELTEFDRVVVLDADTLVLRNIDDLFDRPGLDGPNAVAAAPDFFMPDRFNSGVMLLRPSTDTFGRMREDLGRAGTYDGGDQGFLNTFFAGWYGMPAAHRLPVGYNIPNFIYQFLRGHDGLRAQLEHEAKVLHYMLQKPWKATSTLTGGSEAWWKVYFQVHEDPARQWKEQVHAMEDHAFDRLVALALR